MKVYVEAYYEDGSPILGNCDGQCVIKARNYRRTKGYKSIRHNLRNHTRVAYYKVVSDNGQILETII